MVAPGAETIVSHDLGESAVSAAMHKDVNGGVEDVLSLKHVDGMDLEGRSIIPEKEKAPRRKITQPSDQEVNRRSSAWEGSMSALFWSALSSPVGDPAALPSRSRSRTLPAGEAHGIIEVIERPPLRENLTSGDAGEGDHLTGEVSGKAMHSNGQSESEAQKDDDGLEPLNINEGFQNTLTDLPVQHGDVMMEAPHNALLSDSCCLLQLDPIPNSLMIQRSRPLDVDDLLTEDPSEKFHYSSSSMHPVNPVSKEPDVGETISQQTAEQMVGCQQGCNNTADSTVLSTADNLLDLMSILSSF